MTPCEEIAGQLGALFSCAPQGEYTRVRTPFLYPDGDVVDLYLHKEGGTLIVSDLGESLRWLKDQTVALKRTPRQRHLIEDICMTNGIELFQGMLVARASPEELAAAVMRVGQAAVRVGDLWFTLRNRTVQSITDEVAEYLADHDFKFQRGEKKPGRSGKIWRMTFTFGRRRGRRSLTCCPPEAVQQHKA